MSLIRICSAVNLNKWDKDPCDFASLQKEWFNLDRDPDPSLYWAESESDEVEVAAAHSLTDLSPNLKGAYLLRIEWSDVIGIGAREHVSEKIPGTTGVVHIDFRHWELKNAHAYLNNLLARIRERYLAGEQRFRWVGLPVLRRPLEMFHSLSDHEVIKEAKRRCQHKLGCNTGHLPKPKSSDLRRELRCTPPRIPEQIVRARAFHLYECLGRSDDFQNWKEAEEQLLALYVEGFVSYESVPSIPTSLT